MKPHPTEIREGPAAFDRFHHAMKAIVAVKKSDVVSQPSKPDRAKKRPARRRG